MVISLETGRFDDLGLLFMFMASCASVGDKLLRVHFERAQLANFDLFEVLTG